MKASPLNRLDSISKPKNDFGCRKVEFTSLGLGLVTDVGVLVSHADHDGDVAGAADEGGEDGSGGVIAGESGLDHSRSVVDDQRRRFFVVAHLHGFWMRIKLNEKESLFLMS